MSLVTGLRIEGKRESILCVCCVLAILRDKASGFHFRASDSVKSCDRVGPQAVESAIERTNPGQRDGISCSSTQSEEAAVVVCRSVRNSPMPRPADPPATRQPNLSFEAISMVICRSSAARVLSDLIRSHVALSPVSEKDKSTPHRPAGDRATLLRYLALSTTGDGDSLACAVPSLAPPKSRHDPNGSHVGCSGGRIRPGLYD